MAMWSHGNENGFLLRRVGLAIITRFCQKWEINVLLQTLVGFLVFQQPTSLTYVESITFLTNLKEGSPVVASLVLTFMCCFYTLFN